MTRLHITIPILADESGVDRGSLQILKCFARPQGFSNALNLRAAGVRLPESRSIGVAISVLPPHLRLAAAPHAASALQNRVNLAAFSAVS